MSEGAYSMLHPKRARQGLIAKKVTDKDGKQTTVSWRQGHAGCAETEAGSESQAGRQRPRKAKPVATAPKQPSVPQKEMSDKAKLAKANHKVVGAEIQRYAEEQRTGAVMRRSVDCHSRITSR